MDTNILASIESRNRKLAKAMRQAPTDAERKLWQILRDRRFAQYKFRRQFPIGNYIVDFVCLSEKLIIEADGGQHDDNRDADLARTRWLELNGYCVLRFWNREILVETEGVYICILRALNPELHESEKRE